VLLAKLTTTRLPKVIWEQATLSALVRANRLHVLAAGTPAADECKHSSAGMLYTHHSTT